MKTFFKVIAYLFVLLLLLAGGIAYVGWTISAPQSSAQHARVQASPQYVAGQFINLEEVEVVEGEPSLIASLQHWLLGEEQREPQGEIPVLGYDASQLAQPARDGLHITWLGHATALVEIDGIRVLVDPVFGERSSPFKSFGPARFHPTPFPLSELQNIDAVIISHDHYDHLEEETFKHLAGTKTKLLVPLGLGDLVASWGISSDQYVEMDWWKEVIIGDVELIATPARHYSNRGFFDVGQSIWLSWAIVGPHHKVFYSGDTGYSKYFAEIGKQLGPFDVSLVKIGAYGPGDTWIAIHMPPEHSVKVHQDVNAKVMFPISWATFNLAYHAWAEPMERTVASAAELDVELVTPKVGETVNFAHEHTNETWWDNL